MNVFATISEILKKLNEFFEATTIHGFAYMSVLQTRSTRIIWSLLVLAAAGVATYLLYETVTGFEENYVTQISYIQLVVY